MSCHAKGRLTNNFYEHLLEDRIMGSTEGESSWRPSKVTPAGNPDQYAHLTGGTEGGGAKPPPVTKPPGGTEGGGNRTINNNNSANSSSESNASATGVGEGGQGGQGGMGGSVGNMAISAGNLKQIFIPMPNAQASSNDSGGVDGGTNDGFNILGIFAKSHGDSRVTPQTQSRRDTELVCNVGVNTGTLAGQGFAATTEMGRDIGHNPVARTTAQATYGEAAEASQTSIAALRNCRDRIAPGAANINVPALTFDNVAPPPAPRVVEAPPPAAAPPKPHPHPHPKAKPDCVVAKPQH
jgi:hypothetical protein